MTDAYRVLARKYRPTRFADLIGQEAMVRTLRNALAQGRLAHAFVLTGVRGVGKTTTARILARAFNCIGADGKGGPTLETCGVCTHCVQIAEDRHLDVIEMDAASNTGVDDVRQLIDGVQYRPTSARVKVYIIDEVHMLSKNAFNALLKTLEEPPEHVKFIFATTEINKVPVTVLSRCQRFDLRRIEPGVLAAYLADIAGREGRVVAPEAAALLARAAEGSARDGLSLLDRALAHVEGEVADKDVRDLLGLADRAQLFELFALIMKGEVKPALDVIARLYDDGAEPAALVEDLLDITQLVTRIKAVPELAEDQSLPAAERERAKAMGALSVPVLARAWQMLLKGLGEVNAAPNPRAALDMLAIRLMHATDLPTPGDLARQMGGAGTSATTAAPPRGAPGNGAPRAMGALAPRAAPEAPRAAPTAQALADPQSFLDVVALCIKHHERVVHAHLHQNVHLVGFEPGRITLRAGEHAPRDLAPRLMALLQEWTGRRWVVVFATDQAGEKSLAEQDEDLKNARLNAATMHPLVRAALAVFPGATIEAVRGGFETQSAADDEPTPELPESESDES